MTDVPSQPAPPAGKSELKLRVMSALVMSAFILIATYLGGWLFAIVWTAVAVLMAREWYAITAPQSAQTLFLVSAATIIVSCGAAHTGFWPLAVLMPVLVGFSMPILDGKNLIDRNWLRAGVVYAAWLGVAVILLRRVPGIGVYLILWSFAVVWLTDVAAYFTGRTFGGPKLWPAVSPKKTWSGFAGGAIAGSLGGLGIWWLAQSAGQALALGFSSVLALSLVGSVLGQGGDLAESALKRRFGVKDSGSMIPGHGGFLDRLDAYWAVVVFAAVILLLAGGGR
jgi:phosphatidate cytidylyltransferase